MALPGPSMAVALSRDDLLVIAVFPLLFVGLVAYVAEDLLGLREHVAAAVAGGLLLLCAATAGRGFDAEAAVILRRTVDWRVVDRVDDPVSLYWGAWGVLFTLGALGEWQEDDGDE